MFDISTIILKRWQWTVLTTNSDVSLETMCDTSPGWFGRLGNLVVQKLNKSSKRSKGCLKSIANLYNLHVKLTARRLIYYSNRQSRVQLERSGDMLLGLLKFWNSLIFCRGFPKFWGHYSRPWRYNKNPNVQLASKSCRFSKLFAWTNCADKTLLSGGLVAYKNWHCMLVFF